MNVPQKLENWQYMHVNQTIQFYTDEPQQIINGFFLYNTIFAHLSRLNVENLETFNWILFYYNN